MIMELVDGTLIKTLTGHADVISVLQTQHQIFS